mmetsp:Transcript_83076/g.164790  ORF Transcript_83076/g.164790 Transcript_83076/m.164790 type:complete len:124 (+) Transcript_83076:1264-1635(+)
MPIRMIATEGSTKCTTLVFHLLGKFEVSKLRLWPPEVLNVRSFPTCSAERHVLALCLTCTALQWTNSDVCASSSGGCRWCDHREKPNLAASCDIPVVAATSRLRTTCQLEMLGRLQQRTCDLH